MQTVRLGQLVFVDTVAILASMGLPVEEMGLGDDPSDMLVQAVVTNFSGSNVTVLISPHVLGETMLIDAQIEFLRAAVPNVADILQPDVWTLSAAVAELTKAAAGGQSSMADKLMDLLKAADAA